MTRLSDVMAERSPRPQGIVGDELQGIGAQDNGARRFRVWHGAAVFILLLTFHSSAGNAHSASDAYLTLTVEPAAASGNAVLRGQWDIALRDLDFVMKLDDNGDGRLTWGEVRRHQAAIGRYAYEFLHFDAGGNACAIRPIRQMVDFHADGAYAALYFDVMCVRSSKKIGLNYGLFFALDPSHRGIFVMNNGADTATAVLSPQNASIDLTL